MAYDIRPITELNTFDYSLCSGLQNAETVRKSIDNTLFIVEGETINAYTHQQMLGIVSTSAWSAPIPF
jgi:hypothetical protein